MTEYVVMYAIVAWIFFLVGVAANIQTVADNSRNVIVSLIDAILWPIAIILCITLSFAKILVWLVGKSSTAHSKSLLMLWAFLHRMLAAGRVVIIW